MFDSLFFDTDKRTVGGFWSISGDFGVIDADAPRKEEMAGDGGLRVSCEVGGVFVETELKRDENGLICRTDRLMNRGEAPLVLSRFFARFSFEGCEYQVYTQANTWSHECRGLWQTLNTVIAAENGGTRSCDDASPIMALKNTQNGRVTAFHLAPSCRWKIAAKIVALGLETTATVVEAGLQDSGLALKLAPGESVSLPTLYLTEGTNAVDFDAWKLHRAMNRLYPRKPSPVIYDTWFSNFDVIRFDNLWEQVDIAADLGFEYFCVDAGWFGNGDAWWKTVGDWEENTVGAFAGHLSDFADHVRERGMKFGLWLEPERANENSETVKRHPDWYLWTSDGNRLLDFNNPDAFRFITDKTSELVEKYGIEYFKFDYNATEPFDRDSAAQTGYYAGQLAYYREIRRRHPDVYFTFCASGGFRIDLVNLAIADSLWISDNQGPEEGIRIYRDMLKRMPPAAIEKWAVQTVSGPIPVSGKEKPVRLALSCNDGGWTTVIRVSDEYALHFLSGGPMGFSCDLTALPADYRRKMKRFIADFKKQRGYYQHADARILCESEGLTAIQYSDRDFSDVRIQLFTQKLRQDRLTVYPVLDPTRTYRVGKSNAAPASGDLLSRTGVTFRDLSKFDFYEIDLTSAKQAKNK